jgi:hypothetical protein
MDRLTSHRDRPLFDLQQTRYAIFSSTIFGHASTCFSTICKRMNLRLVEDKDLQKYAHYFLLRSFPRCRFNPTIDKGDAMPMQAQDQSTLNVKLVHFTKQNSPDEPVQVAFAVTDDQGKEEIITGEVPYTYDLFHLLQENGWLNIRRGVASIRETRSQRRAMSA